MSDHEPQHGKLTDHSYDGIQEYDNPMPGWWVWLFHGTVAFSLVYFLLVHLSVFDFSVRGAYARDFARDTETQWAGLPDAEPNAQLVAAFLKPGEERWIAKGREVYLSSGAMCSTCHGPEGAGLVGPNLTDDRYKNVKELGDIVNVLVHGAGNGTMPSAKTQLRLSNKQIAVVAAYVASIRGKNLPTPESVPAALLGEEIPPWKLD